MARRTATKSTEAPAQNSTSPALSLSVRRSEGVKRAERPKQENPVLEAVQASLSEGPLAYDVDSQEAATNVQNLLRRAAQQLGVGLSQSVTANADGTFTVDFEAKETKRSRKYTTDDIRAWYAETYATDAGPAVLTGPVSKEIREAFKVANGYAKSSTEEMNNQG